MADSPRAWTADPDRLERELVQAQKMEAIGQLIAGIAHDLNNPLAAIVAFSQLIQRDPRLPDDLRRDADLLVQEADRTRRIVQSLLDFARPGPPERQPTLLRPLVDRVLDLQSYLIGSGRIDVRVDIPADAPPVPVDPGQLQQVLLNLTLNAIQAIRARGEGGRLWIRSAVDEAGEGATIRLEIGDDGPGVAPEHRDRLFEPFFTTRPPGQGTGLGLPVSRMIIEAHGGRVSLEPADARGATFRIDLPLQPGDEAAPAEPDAEPSARREDPARVLVVDDEPAIRRLLAKALTNAGWVAVVAEDGRQAVERVRAGSFDAVLCDHRLDGMSGADVHAAVVAIRPHLAGRFVLMSGDVSDPELRAFAAPRGIELLAKPFALEAVTAAVRSVLSREAPQPRG